MTTRRVGPAINNYVFRRNNIQIGDLIYDTYLLIYKKPTANFNDENLFNLFVSLTSALTTLKFLYAAK